MWGPLWKSQAAAWRMSRVAERLHGPLDDPLTADKYGPAANGTKRAPPVFVHKHKQLCQALRPLRMRTGVKDRKNGGRVNLNKTHKILRNQFRFES